MIVGKSKIIIAALLIATTSALQVLAADNNLMQLDLKRTSNNSVDVTLYTSDLYNDNVMVRKKSDNKYVILIPKLQSSGFNPANNIKDMVSNIDVKTVNDTTGGYTKVTLITTKPLDIRTKTKKSSPITDEQREYNSLIAQANSLKSSAKEQKFQNNSVPKQQAVKTEAKNNEKPVEKRVEKFSAPKFKLQEIDADKNAKQVRKAHLNELINEVKQEQIAPPVESLETNVSSLQPENLEDIKNVVPVAEQKKPNKLKNFAKSAKSKLPKAGLALLALFCVSGLAKLVKKAGITAENVYNEEFPVSENKYSDITDNKDLSWQEKYKLYLGKEVSPVSRPDNKGSYTFIKAPADIEQKRSELESLLDEQALQDIPSQESIYVEDEIIHKAIKLKAFDKTPISLKSTSRSKSRFKKYEVEIPLHEQKNIELGSSALHTNPRTLKDANLNVSDVDKTRLKFKPQDYILSSIDEYLSILDKEAPARVEAKKVITNPIAKKDVAARKGLIVKSGYNIDEKKGFYLVNNEGQNALVGKINDEVFVLKKFDSNITNPIQVRRDNENVYMVKAGKFKSLVEVKDDKMGVLIEL